MTKELTDAVIKAIQTNPTWQQTIVIGLSLAAIVLITIFSIRGVVAIITVMMTCLQNIFCYVIQTSIKCVQKAGKLLSSPTE